MSDTKILPCPFCGTDAKLTVRDEDAYCPNSKCWLGDADIRVPVEDWNGRQSPSAMAKEAATKAALEIEKLVIDWIAGKPNDCGLAAIKSIILKHIQAIPDGKKNLD